MQITSKLHLINHQIEIVYENGVKENHYTNSILCFGNEIHIIDAGPLNAWKSIKNYILEQGRNPSEVAHLFLSHSHPEQIGSAHQIKKETNCIVYGHMDEKDWFGDIEKQYRERPIAGFYDLVKEAVKIDEFIEHNQVMKFDKDVSVKIFHRPGHSKGHLNFLFIEDETLFVADALLKVRSIPIYDNYYENIETFKRLKATNKVCRYVSNLYSYPLSSEDFLNTLTETELYFKKLNTFININYSDGIERILEHCTDVINDLDLPKHYICPLVDKAFRTHLY